MPPPTAFRLGPIIIVVPGLDKKETVFDSKKLNCDSTSNQERRTQDSLFNMVRSTQIARIDGMCSAWLALTYCCWQVADV